MINRPIMRYPGGKYNLAKWVISHFPAHKFYVELFGGAASVLMRKSRSVGEIYNDLNDDVVNVFRVLRNREQAAELARLLALTPYAKEEYRLAYERCEDPIEQARRMIFRSFAGIGSDSVTRPCAGFRSFKNNQTGVTAASEWAGIPQEISIFTEHLQGVVIEQRDALILIPYCDFTGTLFYADPPYVKSTRSKYNVRYPVDLDNSGHEALSEMLHQIKGMAIISGYRSDLYDRLYSTWRCIQKSSHAGMGKKSVECLWLSPNIQTTLF
jgi:DNA adenine methylase